MSDRNFENMHKHVLQMLKGLEDKLTYHSIDHTVDVICHTERIAMEEGVDEKDIYLLKVAALYHDTGFLFTYAGHEIKSCEIFLADNDKFNFSEAEKKVIIDLIMATRVPQRPNTHLQKIICDADLDYLGRNDFNEIAALLKQEFLNCGIIADEHEWKKLQLNFLENHQYHTESSKTKREPVKKDNVGRLNKKKSR